MEQKILTGQTGQKQKKNISYKLSLGGQAQRVLTGLLFMQNSLTGSIFREVYYYLRVTN